jgi:diguanylate cyclase (GGDEF)-like protein/PAS domain S-box-containing protein
MNLDTIHLLLVENNPGDARLLEECLAEETVIPMYLTTAANLPAACAILSRQTFDVILLDLSQPDDESMDAVSTILKLAPKSPVVVMANYSDDNFALAVVRAGAQDFLAKKGVTQYLLVHSIYYSIERKRIELREYSRMRILEQLSSGAALSEILHIIAHCIEEEKPTMLCSIMILDDQSSRLFVGAAPSLPELLGTCLQSCNYGSASGDSNAAVMTGELVVIDDLQSRPSCASMKGFADELGIKSCWSLPIKSELGKVLGIIALYHRRPEEPKPTDLEFFYDIANLARIAIEKSRTTEELKLAGLVYQNSSQGVAVMDEMGTIITVNPAFTDITGYKLEEVVGENFQMLGSTEQDELFFEEVWSKLRETGCWQGECQSRRKNGQIYAEWLTINTVFSATDSAYRRVALFSDITKLKESEEIIWRQANYDPLTELPNRRMFHDQLKLEIKKSNRIGKPLALLFLDLDRFKEVNDTLGHSLGDQLLKEAASRLSKCIRETDTVARLGGDEFTLILSGLDEIASVDRIAESILARLIEPFQLGLEMAYISASIGVTIYPEDADNSEDLLKNADQAMYAAKARGRNCYHYFTPSMQSAAQKKMRIANDLRTALSDRQFHLAYQPIIDLATGKNYKAEALIRWSHPVVGPINPTEFIHIAEDTGMITDISEWAFFEVAQQVKEWRQTLRGDFQISINKSPVQFQNKANGPTSWFEHLNSLGLPASCIAIEITEGLLLDASHITTDRLFGLRDDGIQVSLDDFGTGYSSLSALKKYDIDYIKIDRSFISNLTADSNDLVLCEAIIAMAHKLGIKVIAEGIETSEQCELLMAAGCDYGQGYLFSKPLTPSEFEELYLGIGGKSWLDFESE